MTKLSLPIIEETKLRHFYTVDKLSMKEISTLFGCSVHKIEYWMNAYHIERRTIGDAVYQKNHPNGDPFLVKTVLTKADTMLLGMGIGLYWGEGNKANKTSIRLGNTDPELLKTFMRFLIELLGVNKNDLRFTLQIFTDINTAVALDYWVKTLHVEHNQFYKPTVTISGSLGTYKKKSEYGVVTINYHNRKLRDILVQMLPR